MLVVEDDVAIRQGVVDALRWQGYEPLETGDGASGRRMALGDGSSHLAAIATMANKITQRKRPC